MKLNLQDTTFLILIRLDSIARLENIVTVVAHLLKNCETNIVILEVDSYNNGFLKSLLNKKVEYVFYEDKDPVLHKTRYFNKLIKQVCTPYIAIWDADVIVEKEGIEDAVNHLRTKEADIALPYKGTCINTSKIVRSLFMKKKDVSILFRNQEKMEKLYGHTLVGGAVIINRQKFEEVGLENENYYGWGDDDFDRYIRFLNADFKIYRANHYLYHLSHPRGENSLFHSSFHGRRSKAELYKTKGQ